LTGKTGDRLHIACAGLFLWGISMQQQPTVIRRKQADFNIDVMRKVTEILKTVNHGSITLIVKGGKVFQINKTENCKVEITGSD
jgi:hypothetical protein